MGFRGGRGLLEGYSYVQYCVTENIARELNLVLYNFIAGRFLAIEIRGGKPS